MKKKLSRKHFEDLMSPEIREVYEEVQRERKEGRLKSAPKNLESCLSLMDLCLYIFKIAGLNGEHQILADGINVKRWVWAGHTFTDRFVQRIERVGPLLPDKDLLQELRLVATRLTPLGIERLRRVFPKCKVEVYSDADADQNWQLTQASFSVNATAHRPDTR